eukprot:3706368-Pyramimonas_sp.AAC.1
MATALCKFEPAVSAGALFASGQRRGNLKYLARDLRCLLPLRGGCDMQWCARQLQRGFRADSGPTDTCGGHPHL